MHRDPIRRLATGVITALIAAATLPAHALAQHGGGGGGHGGGGGGHGGGGGSIDTATVMSIGGVGLVLLVGIVAFILVDARRNAPSKPRSRPSDAKRKKPATGRKSASGRDGAASAGRR